MPLTLRSLKRRLRQVIETSPLGYRAMVSRDLGCSGPHGRPDAPWHNAVLQTRAEVEQALTQVRRLGLPLMGDEPKNWDSLAALDLILKSVANRNARIFDAGGESYSMILPWLALYGYRNLSAGNLTFREPTRRGPITFHHCDITRTGLEAASFDAITCLSVIEHGVDLNAYFDEMARILKPGGTLITSTDYSESLVDTRGQSAYGGPIHIFTPDEIETALRIANTCGLTLTGPLDTRACERPVHWARFDLNYTFIIFSLRKETSTREDSHDRPR